MDVGITNNGKTYFDHKTKLYKKFIKNGVPINCGIIIFTKDCTIYKESLSFLEDTFPEIKIDRLYEKLGVVLAKHFSACQKETTKRTNQKLQEDSAISEIDHEKGKSFASCT